MHFIRVPSLAENVNEATIAEWIVEKGDEVHMGAPIAELVTEKAEFTLQIEEDIGGVVLERLAEEKSVLPVGFILCVIGESGNDEAVKAAMGENAALLQKRANTSTVAISKNDIDMPQNRGREGRVRATPAARRLAKEKGILLEDVADMLHIRGAVKEEHIHTYLEEC